MKHHKRSSRLSAAAVVLGLCASVDAYAIDYSVNLAATGGGTLTGTISTDGTLGNIAGTNFTGFSLTWTFGNIVMLINNNDGNSELFVNDFPTAQKLQATASGLFMLTAPSTEPSSFTINSSPGLSFQVNSASSRPDPFRPGLIRNTAARAEVNGNFILGGDGFDRALFPISGTQFTIGTVTAVPESSAYALMGLGLLGVGAVVRRQRTAA